MSAPDVREENAGTRDGAGSSPSKAGEGAAGSQSLGRAARMADRLEERRENHLRRSKPHRIAVIVVGFLVTLLGVVMTGPIPGPGFLVIPLGLALLALEFAWAERLLQRALAWADSASRKANEQSTPRKVAAGVAFAVVVAAGVTAAILWDIPVLPV
jgi:uncharacterized protein (TIGR02611 family)